LLVHRKQRHVPLLQLQLPAIQVIILLQMLAQHVQLDKLHAQLHLQEPSLKQLLALLHLRLLILLKHARMQLQIVKLKLEPPLVLSATLVTIWLEQPHVLLVTLIVIHATLLDLNVILQVVQLDIH